MRGGVWVAVLLVGCVLPGRDRSRGPSDDPYGSQTVLRGLGDRCTQHLDCQSGFCLDITDDGLPSFCSSECLQGGCPSGMVCRGIATGVSLCGFDAPPTGAEIGAACRFDLDCLSGLCVDLAGDDRGKFCTRPCDTRACPMEMICASLDSGERLCVTPPPEGAGGVGQTCRTAIDCRSGMCIDVAADAYGPYCSELCSSDGDCPSGMGCFSGSDGSLRCLFRSGAASLGSFCQTDADCASGICIDVYGDAAGAYCTDACRGDIDCPTGMACSELPGLGPSCIY